MSAHTFRRKPLLVKGMQWTGDNEAELRAWTGGDFALTAMVDRITDPDLTGQVWVEPHSAWVPMRTGDWVMRDIYGEHYPTSPLVLEAMCDPADDKPDDGGHAE